MHVTVDHVVPHPVDRVFAVITDPARRADWQENTSDVQREGDGPVGVGTRWTEHQRGVGHVAHAEGRGRAVERVEEEELRERQLGDDGRAAQAPAGAAVGADELVHRVRERVELG